MQQQNPNKNNNNLHTQKLRLLKAQADKAGLSIKVKKALSSLIGTITYTILQLGIPN
ncbi:MAG: hypothetical protein LN566_00400 [Rickettsia endosymbiont of Stiretrus anchorago]|nr:hypothetical protein [Rickettsia endosymbiont of Stiretrus anchorago]